MSKPCPVVHFEMPYADRNRMAQFYKSAFGWQMQMMGEDMGNYVLALTTETANGCATTPGHINGGFFPASTGSPIQQHPSVVIAVEDIETAIESVASAGGKVLGQAMQIPGIGLYVAFADTEGNHCSMLQPLRPDGCQKAS